MVSNTREVKIVNPFSENEKYKLCVLNIKQMKD